MDSFKFGMFLAGCWVFFLLCGQNRVAAENAEPEPGKLTAWKPGKQTELKGVRINLSQPALVARHRGYLWFPTVTRMVNGDLLSVATNYPDIPTENSIGYYSWSTDGGLSWSTPFANNYCEVSLTLANGDVLLLPYYLRPAPNHVMTASYFLCPLGKRELILKTDGIRVSGWDRPDRGPDPKLNLSSFVFNGQTQRLKDGTYVATLYGNYKGEKRTSLVLAESRDGRDWRIRGTIADEHCKLPGNEGPSESAMCRMRDGRLMSVFRNASFVPFGQAFSSDEGKTWSTPVAMPGVFSVQPSLQTMSDGTVFLSGGRPGLYLWVNADREGRVWEQVDIRANHNEFAKGDPIIRVGSNSTNYAEIVVLDDSHLLYIYDRVPYGWDKLPAKSSDTSSVWVVRLTINMKP